MHPRFDTWTRRLLLALLCAGLLGLGGCKRTFYRQQSHAMGGGTVGKGYAQPPMRRTERRPDSGLGSSSAMGGLLDGKRSKRSAKAGLSSSSSVKRKPSTAKRIPSSAKRKSSAGSKLFDTSSPFSSASSRRGKSQAR